MKTKLIFDLTDSDDRQEFERCVKSSDMASVIWTYLRNSRKEIEQQLENNEGEIDVFEAVHLCFERFTELLDESGINIDELYS